MQLDLQIDTAIESLNETVTNGQTLIQKLGTTLSGWHFFLFRRYIALNSIGSKLL